MLRFPWFRRPAGLGQTPKSAHGELVEPYFHIRRFLLQPVLRQAQDERIMLAERHPGQRRYRAFRGLQQRAGGQTQQDRCQGGQGHRQVCQL